MFAGFMIICFERRLDRDRKILRSRLISSSEFAPLLSA